MHNAPSEASILRTLLNEEIKAHGATQNKFNELYKLLARVAEDLPGDYESTRGHIMDTLRRLKP